MAQKTEQVAQATTEQQNEEQQNEEQQRRELLLYSAELKEAGQKKADRINKVLNDSFSVRVKADDSEAVTLGCNAIVGKKRTIGVTIDSAEAKTKLLKAGINIEGLQDELSQDTSRAGAFAEEKLQSNFKKMASKLIFE